MKADAALGFAAGDGLSDPGDVVKIPRAISSLTSIFNAGISMAERSP